MIAHLSIHHPKPGAEEALIDSMHRYGAAIKDAPGLFSVHTLRDDSKGILMGLALWESEEARQASIHLARAAVANDPFDEWEAEPIQGFLLHEV
jgi:heme-degrading monooxygenase HmoA